MVLPGELVKVRLIREHTSYLLAEVESILESSPFRVKPRCDYFFICGGCDWQHISYEQQVQYKSSLLHDELTRMSPDERAYSHPDVASPRWFGYRCHATLQCSYTTEFLSGFFKKASRDIVVFDSCPVLNDTIQSILPELRTILNRHPIYSVTSIEIHAPQDELLVLVRCRGSLSRHDLKTMHRIYDELPIAGLSFVSRGDKRRDHVLGQRFSSYEISSGGLNMNISSGFGGFMQANMGINNILVEHLMNLVQSPEIIMELFSGSGNFSIPLSFAAREVTAIERNSRLAAQGKLNAKKNSAGNVKFIAMDALKAMQLALNESLHFDTVVLDPPREGARHVMELLPKTPANKIIYISCNPSTLSRDVSILRKAGFSLKSLRFFDMFPQTYHIESVACLER